MSSVNFINDILLMISMIDFTLIWRFSAKSNHLIKKTLNHKGAKAAECDLKPLVFSFVMSLWVLQLLCSKSVNDLNSEVCVLKLQTVRRTTRFTLEQEPNFALTAVSSRFLFFGGKSWNSAVTSWISQRHIYPQFNKKPQKIKTKNQQTEDDWVWKVKLWWR